MTTTPQPPMPTVKPAKTAGLAIAALALGCCSFIPCLGVVCGIIGIIFGIVALSKNLGGKGLAIGGIVTGVVGILLVQVILMTAMILPALGRARGLAKQACCEVNLDGIGKAMQIYSANNNDKYPPNLQVLLDENLITPNLLKCLSADSDRECDYAYLLPADDATDKTILACDLKDNHSEGRNVLYADFSVSWLDEETFQEELRQPWNAAFAEVLKRAEEP